MSELLKEVEQELKAEQDEAILKEQKRFIRTRLINIEGRKNGLKDSQEVLDSMIEDTNKIANMSIKEFDEEIKSRRGERYAVKATPGHMKKKRNFFADEDDD